MAHSPRSTATNPGWDAFPSLVSLLPPPHPPSRSKKNRISASLFMMYGTFRDILPSSIEIIIMITSENRYEHGVSNFLSTPELFFPSIIENCYREAICDLFPKFLILYRLKTETQFSILPRSCDYLSNRLVIIFFSKVQIQHRSSCGLRGRLEGLHYI